MTENRTDGCRRRGKLGAVDSLQPGQKLGFGRMNHFLGFLDGKKGGAVNLRKFSLLPGFGGPLHRERVAVDCLGVTIALKGPSDNRFPAPVLDRAQREKAAVRLEACFFFEFSSGGDELIFARMDFSLGDEPGAGIFFCPKWTAWMDEENFQTSATRPVHDQAGADLSHTGSLSFASSILNPRGRGLRPKVGGIDSNAPLFLIFEVAGCVRERL
jgi:hypothetical protein